MTSTNARATARALSFVGSRGSAEPYDLAEVTLTKLQHQVEERHPTSAITVRQAVEQWLEAAELADTTRERYEDLIRLCILPAFGSMRALPNGHRRHGSEPLLRIRGQRESHVGPL